MTKPTKPLTASRKPGRPPIDLSAKIRDILDYTAPLSPSAERPFAHFEEHATAIDQLLKYVDRHLTTQSIYQVVYDRHMARLRRMAFVALVEAFERFLNELAIICVDRLARYVNDGRFDRFSATGSEIAAHFAAGSIGKALCESSTWLNNKEVNERFRRLLKSPFGDNWKVWILPDRAKSNPDFEKKEAESVAVPWQIRHTIVHNTGILTASDAIKLTLLLGQPIDADRVLTPSRQDFRYAKRLLVRCAKRINGVVGTRLAHVLTEIHSRSPQLFEAQHEANAVSQAFQLPITVADRAGAP